METLVTFSSFFNDGNNSKKDMFLKELAESDFTVGHHMNSDDFEEFKKIALKNGIKVTPEDFNKYFDYFNELRNNEDEDMIENNSIMEGTKPYKYVPDIKEWQKMYGYFKNRSRINFASASEKKCIDRYLIARYVKWADAEQCAYEKLNDYGKSRADMDAIYDEFVKEMNDPKYNFIDINTLVYEFNKFNDSGYNMQNSILPKSVNDLFRKNHIIYKTKSEKPYRLYSNEYSNGRVYSVGAEITLHKEDGYGSDKQVVVHVVNHTNEGGGSYGYSAKVDGNKVNDVSIWSVEQVSAGELVTKFFQKIIDALSKEPVSESMETKSNKGDVAKTYKYICDILKTKLGLSGYTKKNDPLNFYGDQDADIGQYSIKFDNSKEGFEVIYINCSYKDVNDITITVCGLNKGPIITVIYKLESAYSKNTYVGISDEIESDFNRFIDELTVA